MNRAETGRKGEAAAAKFYLQQGCRLLAHNFRTRMGELDVVVQEPDGTIVICEVKTRAEGSLTTPAEAVDKAKQRRLIRAAQSYLQVNGLSDAPVRFDVAEGARFARSTAKKERQRCSFSVPETKTAR